MLLADPDEDVEVVLVFEGDAGYTKLPFVSQEYISDKKQSPPHLSVGTPSMTGHKKSPS